jgi:hypothetical protein
MNITKSRKIDRNAHLSDFKAYMRVREMVKDFSNALSLPEYAYSRCLMAGGSRYVAAYAYDSKSPTGVIWIASCLDFDEAVSIMDSKGKSFPLSPTEGLNKTGV